MSRLRCRLPCQNLKQMVHRDDVEHPGRSLAWGPWAITNDDPEFRGRGAQDSGDDYGPAPGEEQSVDGRGQGGRVVCCTQAVRPLQLVCSGTLVCRAQGERRSA